MKLIIMMILIYLIAVVPMMYIVYKSNYTLLKTISIKKVTIWEVIFFRPLMTLCFIVLTFCFIVLTFGYI